jgi:type IV pilus assembly protein PilP
VLSWISGCGGTPQPETKEKEIATQKQTVKKIPAKKKEKQETSEARLLYQYDPMGKKDPFKPLIKTDSRIAEKMKVQGELTPLQRYNLAELKLVAIIVGGENSKAMVEDSKGDGYIISKGTLIGNQFGEVAEIKSNEVIIIEKEVDPATEEIISKEVSLILHKPEEEEL